MRRFCTARWKVVRVGLIAPYSVSAARFGGSRGRAARGCRARCFHRLRAERGGGLAAGGLNPSGRALDHARHTALTHEAAAGNPHAHVQAKAGHSQSTITDRYIHAAQVLFPGAAEKAEARMFGVAG
jgi:integrase